MKEIEKDRHRLDCSKCKTGYRYSSIKKRKAHEKRCEGFKYTCDKCANQKYFSKFTKLKEHIQKEHQQQVQLLYAFCISCNVTFTHQSYLREHLKRINHSIDQNKDSLIYYFDQNSYFNVETHHQKRKTFSKDIKESNIKRIK